MITRMEVFSAQADAPELPLGGFGPNDDAIQVRNIEGLGPVKADITTTPFAVSRGALYQGSTIGTRNIVLTLGLNPDFVTYPSMHELRRILYRYLLPGAWTKFRFYTIELPPVEIEGYVESFEPNMFSEDPEVQVSVICPNPDFMDPVPTVITGQTVEFTDDATEFSYTGSVPTGFELKVEPSTDNPDFTGNLIVNAGPPPEEVFTVTPVTIDATNYVVLSTAPKKIQSFAGFGAPLNLLASVSAESKWPLIRVGTNKIGVFSYPLEGEGGTGDEIGLGWTLAYFARYGGL